MTYSAGEPGTSRVLVVGIDGVRFDALTRCRTPALDAVARAGFLAPVQVDAAGPTISGPCWATIATGTLPAAHGIWDNEVPSDTMPPDFLAVARGAGRSTFAAAAWPPLLTPADCGPVFAPGGPVMLPPDPGNDPSAWDRADDAVARAAAGALPDADAAFVYLGVADEVAHAVGVGPDYFAAIEACDRRLGLLLTAIADIPDDAAGAAGGARRAPWTVIVATDHGHVDAGGHGGDSAEERTAWIAACGPGAALLRGAGQAGIFDAVLRTLGIRPAQRPRIHGLGQPGDVPVQQRVAHDGDRVDQPVRDHQWPEPPPA